jgi:hypothetical protein
MINCTSLGEAVKLSFNTAYPQDILASFGPSPKSEEIIQTPVPKLDGTKQNANLSVGVLTTALGCLIGCARRI